MGTYTSIKHPSDDRELQIKTGYDCCDWYAIGDRIPCHVVREIYGCGGIFDGVYSSYSALGDDDWVIIKNHKVLCCEPRVKNYKYLLRKYKIKKPSKSWWSKKAYAKHLAAEKVIREEHKKFRLELRKSKLAPREKLGIILSYPLRKQLDMASVLRRALVVTDMYVAPKTTRHPRCKPERRPSPY